MEDEILPILKYSYDNLKGEKVKSCLLYCALFPEDGGMSKMDLIKYWICEGIIDDSEGMKKAENKGYEIIGILVHSSLLMEDDKYEDEDKFEVYMHDVVCEMALWIASDFGKQKYNFMVHVGVGLYEMPKLKNWNVVKRVSLMDNKIDRITTGLDCFQLTTLFLQRNETLSNISSEFFKSMPRLVVLDVSRNKNLSELPDEISELSVVGISALLNLKVLKLQCSGIVYSSKTKEELQVLENLEILTIDIKSRSGLDEFLNSHKVMCCTRELKIVGCQLESSDIWRLASMEKVVELHLVQCTISEIKMDIASIRRENPKNAFFLGLSKIYLQCCKCPKELTWLMFATNLTELIIEGSNQLEEIINKEKACEGERSEIVLFQKLKSLNLEELPELKNIYWRDLFCHFHVLQISE